MKKKMIMLVAAAMMTLSAGSAFAAFGDAELFRIVYDRTGAEIGTDLGNVKSILAAPANPYANALGSVAPATGFAVYFAIDRTTNELWASGVAGTPSTITGSGSGLTGAKNGFNAFIGNFNNVPNSSYTSTAGAINSFKNRLSATQGNLASSITAGSRLNTEVSLASLLTANDSVSQSLYYWGSGLTTVAANKIGTEVATITTSLTSTNIAPTSATPIPPAFFLMGSGLLGMFGLRRKNKVA